MKRFNAGVSTSANTNVRRDVRFIFWDLLPRLWRFFATPAFTRPDPVTLKRFLTELLVFILGILCVLKHWMLLNRRMGMPGI